MGCLRGADEAAVGGGQALHSVQTELVNPISGASVLLSQPAAEAPRDLPVDPECTAVAGRLLVGRRQCTPGPWPCSGPAQPTSGSKHILCREQGYLFYLDELKYRCSYLQPKMSEEPDCHFSLVFKFLFKPSCSECCTLWVCFST